MKTTINALLNALTLMVVVRSATACPYLNERRLQRDGPPRQGPPRNRAGPGGRGDGPGERGGGGRDQGHSGRGNGPDGNGPDGNDGGGRRGGGILSAEDAVPIQDLSVDQALTLARNDIRSIMNGNRAAEFVRLAFHDCVGGICDGCVDTSIPDNFGLDNPIEKLEGIFITYSETLTRGDIWVLAGMTAAEEAQQTGSPVQFDMEYVGRPSCADPQGGPDRTMPSPHMTSGALTTFFRENFMFTDRETAAILGAHTLGRAVRQNSGFNGNQGWVRNQNRLDNEFYNVLLDGDEVDNNFSLELQENNGNQFPDQFLWRRGNRNDFMLNVDVALAKNFDGYIDPVSGGVSCTLNGDCPDSPLLGFAMEYAQSNDVWISDFHGAFVKMTSIGCEGVCDII